MLRELTAGVHAEGNYTINIILLIDARDRHHAPDFGRGVKRRVVVLVAAITLVGVLGNV